MSYFDTVYDNTFGGAIDSPMTNQTSMSDNWFSDSLFPKLEYEAQKGLDYVLDSWTSSFDWNRTGVVDNYAEKAAPTPVQPTEPGFTFSTEQKNLALAIGLAFVGFLAVKAIS